MAFRDRNLSFEEADRRYAELVRKRRSGTINDREFDDERKRLMVLDKQGRWWAKSAATGEWNYHDGKAWVKGVPPGYPSPTGGAPATAAPGSRAEARRSDSPYSKSPAQQADDDGQRASRVPFLGLILVAGVLLLGLLGWGAYTLTRDTVESDTGKNVKVPDLAGAASLKEARKIAGDDFEVVEGKRVESQKPIGTILGQDPAAGEMAEPSSSISVDLSKGVNLPDVKGETREKAIKILAEKGFQVEGKFKKSSAEDKDRVIGQDPQGGEGESVEAGTAVEITIGTGPTGTQTGTSVDASSPGTTQIPVPDVVGATAVEAAQTLENAGFTYDVQTVQSYEPAGTVVSTDPTAGTPLDPASRSVTINQSSGPPAAEEPAPATAPPTYTEPPYTEPPYTEPPTSPDPSSPDPSSPEASPGATDEGS